jgi:voltage-gated potassium channel
MEASCAALCWTLYPALYRALLSSAHLTRCPRASPCCQISPFTSISAALYYVVVTVTTVGFGDLYPTSTGGRALACAFAYIGTLLWTFPLAIIGKTFVVEFKAMRAA